MIIIVLSFSNAEMSEDGRDDVFIYGSAVNLTNRFQRFLKV
jgi:hypothetical protein